MALARVQYTQEVSGNLNFTVPMPYISTDDIFVSVNGVDVSYSWLNDSTVQLTTAPNVGAVIDVRRETNRTELLVDFQDASTITEEQLDLSAKQSFFIAQESFDQTGGSLAVANDGSYSANGRRISNVGDPDSDDDAANVRWVKAQYQSGKDAHQERLLAEAARNAAQASESAAATSETNTLSYRNTTLTYKNETEAARDAAAVSETNAKTSETNAAASQTASKNSETAAQAAAQAAATSEANALTYRNTANASASSASSNATSAGDSAAKASQWAELPEDVAVEPGKYSAKHHAIKASANSASAAMSATNAAAYRDTAYEHRQAAAASAADSASSATASQSSADASATSASESAASAAEAAGYAAGLNVPSAVGNGGKVLAQKVDETGFEYITQGSGGGLDADTLDGKDSTEFADVAHGHTGLSVSEWSGVRSETAHGYIDLGPANADWAHIYTDRPNFYFNKNLYVGGARVYHTSYKPSLAWGSVQITGYVNSMDGILNWTAPNGTVVVGAYSYHNNGTEDRQWKFRYRSLSI